MDANMDASSDSYFPFDIKYLDQELLEARNKYFKGETFVSVGPKKYMIYEQYKDIAAKIYNLKLRNDDIFILGYPRSGTTITEELVWIINNDMDIETALATSLAERCPYLEAHVLMNENTIEWAKTLNLPQTDEMEKFTTDPVKIMEVNKPPRHIKSHLPLSLLPPSLIDTAKSVYLARDPRDVAVSHYHLLRNSVMVKYECDFKTYWEFFMKDALVFTPFIEHIKEAWQYRNHPNMLFLFYEELRKDLPSVVRRVAKFLGKEYSDKQFDKLCDHLSFSNSKKNLQINAPLACQFHGLEQDSEGYTFVRKGKVGGWTDYFDEEMTAKTEKWLAEKLKDTDLRFPTFTFKESQACGVLRGGSYSSEIAAAY